MIRDVFSVKSDDQYIKYLSYEMNVPEKYTSDTLIYVFKCDSALLFKLTSNINVNFITLSNYITHPHRSPHPV